MFYEVKIVPLPANTGQWRAQSPSGPGWTDAETLVSNITQGPWTLYELGVDQLPDEVEDIRSKIQGTPLRAFALVHDADVWASVEYVGIVAQPATS